jgi:hypothetical protein
MSEGSKVDFTNLATIKEFCKTLVKGGKLQTQNDCLTNSRLTKNPQLRHYQELNLSNSIIGDRKTIACLQ